MHGVSTLGAIARIGLTYIVPYLVATSGARAATRLRPPAAGAVGE